MDISSYKGLDEMDKRILNVLQQESQLSKITTSVVMKEIKSILGLPILEDEE
ncbi:hypothetical protein ACQKKK_10755 [Peribacillus sp. NPDC006672]|uniref:hypothetical protein n=1 Tax=Peribacillus sp. NPDC006672 TaxID=3390606 RepID=UPI003CFC66C0